jgi:electron transfer flavoprotein alpha subunit
MSKVLIVAEHLGGKLNAATAKCVSAAQALSPEIHRHPRAGRRSRAVAAEAAQIAGVAKVITVANAANANAIAQVQAPQVAALAAGYSHVFGPAPPSART